MPRISPEQRQATRLRLIDAGKAEFAERGLAGARFDEISLAAGHAKGTIYNYF
ncbi:MAG: TetR family transcriptional regulator, partial [Actinomycetota bacterium]|nr:TetR family transcriptional regulator [Actinomycetota bacterium]